MATAVRTKYLSFSPMGKLLRGKKGWIYCHLHVQGRTTTAVDYYISYTTQM